MVRAPLQSGTVQVHVIRPADLALEAAKSHLVPREHTRAAAFRFAGHADLWTRYRASLRLILAAHLGCVPIEVPILIGEYGKPHLPASLGLHFNLSHDHELALVALSVEGPVGVDLEHLKRATDLPSCAESFCHPAELAARPDDLELLRIWTAKEAFVKALGTGFMTSPERIRISGDTAIGEAGNECPLHRLQHPALTDHIAHLCALRPIGSVVILDEPVGTELIAAPER